MADPAFGVPLKAINLLRRKLNVPTARWTDVWQEAHDMAFMVAGAETDALVGHFHQAVLNAIAEGQTLDQFREAFDRIVAEHGWSYPRRARLAVAGDLPDEPPDGDGGRTLGANRRVQERRPWLRYVAVMDQRTQPLHAAWHKTVLHCDDPWWDTHFPPNGWNCRSSVQALSDRDLGRYRLSVSAQAPPSPLVAKAVRARARS